MSLDVLVQSGKNLPIADKRSRSSDPFVTLKFQGKKQKTKWIDKELNPQWNESFSWSLRGPLDPSETIKVEVLDHEKLGPAQFMGSLDVSLAEAVSRKEAVAIDQKIKNKKGEEIEVHTHS